MERANWIDEWFKKPGATYQENRMRNWFRHLEAIIKKWEGGHRGRSGAYRNWADDELRDIAKQIPEHKS